MTVMSALKIQQKGECGELLTHREIKQNTINRGVNFSASFIKTLQIKHQGNVYQPHYRNNM